MAHSVSQLSWKQKAPEEILKDQAEEIRKALSGTVEKERETVSLNAQDLKEALAAKNKQVVKGLADGQKSLQELIREAETALGLSPKESSS